MKLQHVFILLVAVAITSAALTKYYYPNVEYKDKVVEKEVVRNDIRTIVKEVIKADGSKEIITETTDKSVKKESKEQQITKNAQKNWLLGVSALSKLNDPAIGYELSVARRQLGPFYLIGKVGVVKSETQVGLGIGLEY